MTADKSNEVAGGGAASSRVMFAFWGRRGPLCRLSHEIGRAALADKGINATISVSRQSENFQDFAEFGSRLFPVSTFSTNAGAATSAWRIPVLRRQLMERIAHDRIELVVELMPHVWSFAVMPAAKRAGARYITIIHDADAHPGDATSVVKGLLDRSMKSAEGVCTLSAAVADRLLKMKLVPPERLFTLFHPDLTYGPTMHPPPLGAGPVRLLFLGRILPYKGLSLFLDAVDVLVERGVPVHVGVFGEGALGGCAERLRRLDAEVVNRWLSETEIADVLPRFHAMVLPYVEASQSGVAAAAFGAGLPVIATPVGGLVEQVDDGVTGIVAKSLDPADFAAAIERLADPGVYRAVQDNVSLSSGHRSVRRFVHEIVSRGLTVSR